MSLVWKVWFGRFGLQNLHILQTVHVLHILHILHILHVKPIWLGGIRVPIFLEMTCCGMIYYIQRIHEDWMPRTLQKCLNFENFCWSRGVGPTSMNLMTTMNTITTMTARRCD